MLVFVVFVLPLLVLFRCRLVFHCPLTPISRYHSPLPLSILSNLLINCKTNGENEAMELQIMCSHCGVQPSHWRSDIFPEQAHTCLTIKPQVLCITQTQHETKRTHQHVITTVPQHLCISIYQLSFYSLNVKVWFCECGINKKAIYAVPLEIKL